MKKEDSDPENPTKNILLVQFRTDQSEAHERDCFKEAFSDHNVTFESVNAVKNALSGDMLEGKDGVILGGSGEFYLSQGDGKDTWAPKAEDFIKRTLDKNVPTLGICFGYQMLGKAMGGDVVRDPESMETGTFAVTSLPGANDDPLFTGVPETFEAQLGHKDVLVGLNGNTFSLAESEKVHPQGFRVKGVDAWGVLFHPELNTERMKQRISMFEGYLPPDAKIEDVFKDTPEAAKVLDNFAQIIS